MKTKLLVISLTVFLAGGLFFPVFADNEGSRGGVLRNIHENREQVRDDVQQNKQERKDLLQNIKDLRLMFGRLLNATITGINGTTLTVTDNGKTYTVQTDSLTTIRRHFWGSSTVSEMSVNDKVNVWGKYTDDTKTTIQATMIRDLSIMKRFGVFFGSVTGVNGSALTVDTVNRGVQTATFDSNTKCVQRNEQTMNCSDIQSNQKIRIKGMWNETNKTITNITEIKDFSVPAITPTP